MKRIIIMVLKSTVPMYPGYMYMYIVLVSILYIYM